MSTKLRRELMSGAESMDADQRTLNEVATKSKRPVVTIEDRLKHGNLTIDEVCALKPRGKTGFYADRKAGLVTIQKIGSRSVVPGPIAKAYIRGES